MSGGGLAGFTGGFIGNPSDLRNANPLDNTPKDFEKVPAYRMKDGRVLSRDEALVAIRKEQLFKSFRDEDKILAAAHLTHLAKFIAEHGDKILSILQSSIKALD